MKKKKKRAWVGSEGLFNLHEKSEKEEMRFVGSFFYRNVTNRSGAGSWVLRGQSGVHHPLSPVIGLGLPNQRKKESKKERK